MEQDDIKQIDNTYLNIDKIELSGIDAELNYLLNVGDLLDLEEETGLHLNVTATYLIKWDYFNKSRPTVLVDPDNPDAGILNKEAGEVGDPSWRGNLGATVFYGPFSVNYQLRYISAQDYNVETERTGDERDPFVVPSTFYSDVNVRYIFRDFPSEDQNLAIFAGVNNLMDNPPPYHPSTVQGWNSLYDTIGRFIFAGASMKF